MSKKNRPFRTYAIPANRNLGANLFTVSGYLSIIGQPRSYNRDGLAISRPSSSDLR